MPKQHRRTTSRLCGHYVLTPSRDILERNNIEELQVSLLLTFPSLTSFWNNIEELQEAQLLSSLQLHTCLLSHQKQHRRTTSERVDVLVEERNKHLEKLKQHRRTTRITKKTSTANPIVKWTNGNNIEELQVDVGPSSGDLYEWVATTWNNIEELQVPTPSEVIAMVGGYCPRCETT